MESIEIKYAWKRSYVEGRKIPLHSHDFWEFVFYRKGIGETVIGGKVYSFREGSFALIPPEVKHSESHVGSDEVFIIGFRREKSSGKVLFSQEQDPIVGELVHKIRREGRKKEPNYETMIQLYTLELATLLERGHREETSNKSNTAVQSAINYIDEYALTEIDLKGLAESIGYCEDRFRNLFKEKTGMTPKQYILEKRLEAAKNMLASGEESLESISIMTGFKYYSRFCLFFKERTGYTPKSYRFLYRAEGSSESTK